MAWAARRFSRCDHGDKVHVRGTVDEIGADRVLVSFDSLYYARCYMKPCDIVHVESPPLKVGDVVEGRDGKKRIVAIVGCHAWITTLDGDKEPYKCGLVSLVRVSE